MSFQFGTCIAELAELEGPKVHTFAIRCRRRDLDDGGADVVEYHTGSRLRSHRVEKVLGEAEDELELEDHNGVRVTLRPLTLERFEKHLRPQLMRDPPQKFKTTEELVGYLEREAWLI